MGKGHTSTRREEAECSQELKGIAEHQRPAGLYQPLPVAEWKWDHVTMDCVTGLPKTEQGFNGVWVIVDRLTKSAHFLLKRTTSPH